MAQPNVPGVDPQIQAACDAFRRDYKAVFDEVGKVIVGHKDIIDGVLTCLFVGGHALLEGVPGLGKTALIRALADALHLKFSRIQFTPDLMPADVIGTNVILDRMADIALDEGNEFPCADTFVLRGVQCLRLTFRVP